MAKEICLHHLSEAIPGDALFSIRAGSVRRQAALSNGKPFRFPKVGIAESPIKIDILQPIGTAYIVVKPDHESYQATFKGPRAEGMSCEIEIRTPEGEEEDDKEADAAENAKTAKDAKAYLESHSILSFVQAVLQTVVKERPEDPYQHIARHFACGYDVENPSATRSATAFMKSKKMAMEQTRQPIQEVAGETAPPTPVAAESATPAAAAAADQEPSTPAAADAVAAEPAPSPTMAESPPAVAAAADQEPSTPAAADAVAAEPAPSPTVAESPPAVAAAADQEPSTPAAADAVAAEPAPSPTVEVSAPATPAAVDQEPSTPAAATPSAAKQPETPVTAVAPSPTAADTALAAAAEAAPEQSVAVDKTDALKFKMRSTFEKGQMDGSLARTLQAKRAAKVAAEPVPVEPTPATAESTPAAAEPPAAAESTPAAAESTPAAAEPPHSRDYFKQKMRSTLEKGHADGSLGRSLAAKKAATAEQ